MARTSSSIDKNEMVIRAVDMLKEGFRTSIVRLQTGLSSSMVRACHREIWGGENASAGSLPESHIILKERSGLIEGSVFMTIYSRLGGDGAKDSIDVDTLIRAHRLYMKARCNFDVQERRALDINRAWILARDYRSRVVNTARCSCCSTRFAYSIHTEKSCPFCNQSRFRQTNLAQPTQYDFGKVLPLCAPATDEQQHRIAQSLVAKWAE